MKSNTSKGKTTTRPHVKWGALVLSVVFASIELVLIFLSFYAKTGKLAGANVGLGFLAAYGWLLGAFALVLPSWGYLSEDFIPSYKKYKAWKQNK